MLIEKTNESQQTGFASESTRRDALSSVADANSRAANDANGSLGGADEPSRMSRRAERYRRNSRHRLGGWSVGLW